MTNQKNIILKKEWKYLVVLDACRYDYFSRLCDIPGRLKKVNSPAFQGVGAPTSVWYRLTFESIHRDIIHISSHPRVNSKMEVEGFKGGEHFFRVVDLWDSEWNEEIGTVLPESVTKKAIEEFKKFPEKKFIIHYMQPHTPYISLGPPTTKKKKTPESRTSISRRLRNFTVAKARSLIGDNTAVKIMKVLGLPPLSPMDDALRKVGEDGVKKAYRKNLSRALRCVKKLINSTEGKVVITADHGELLGEGGRFGHELQARPELVEVPWFEVKDGQK